MWRMNSNFENRLRFDRIIVKRLWSHFLAHPVCCRRGGTGAFFLGIGLCLKSTSD